MKARGCTENKPVSDRNRQESDQGSRQERPLARDVGWRGGLRTKSDAHMDVSGEFCSVLPGSLQHDAPTFRPQSRNGCVCRRIWRGPGRGYSATE